ncbi:MAG: hypothetical protein ACFFBS_02000 [Promethearchaeota archaeon]
MSQDGKSKKELIRGVFDGIVPEEIPLNIELGVPEIEAQYGDIVNISCRISRFRRFYETGGPFGRSKGTIRRWAERFDIDTYKWPNPKAIGKTLREEIAHTVKQFGSRFIICKILGPTETAEGFCASGQDEKAKRLDQVQHNFDFAMLSFLNPESAGELHKRVTTYIEECIRTAGSLMEVDAIRIADDAFDYNRPLYPNGFIETVYLPTHEILANLIHNTGKLGIMHCDGDILILNVAKRLSNFYRGFHPLDLVSRITAKDAQNWIRRLGEARKTLPESVFFTGIPVEFLYDSRVSSEELCEVCRKAILSVGKRYLVLSTTHRPFPGSSIKTQGVIEKIGSIRKLI